MKIKQIRHMASVSLSDKMYDRLIKYSDVSGLDKSEIIRLALDQLFRERLDDQKEDK